MDADLDENANDSAMENDSEPCMNPYYYFRADKSVMSDTGFRGTGVHIIHQFKRNQWSAYYHRREINCDISKQKIVNNWSVSLISNSFRIFLDTEFMKIRSSCNTMDISL